MPIGDARAFFERLERPQLFVYHDERDEHVFKTPDDTWDNEKEESHNYNNGHQKIPSNEFPERMRRPQIPECDRTDIVMHFQEQLILAHADERLKDGPDNDGDDQEEYNRRCIHGTIIRLDLDDRRKNLNEKEEEDKKPRTLLERLPPVLDCGPRAEIHVLSLSHREHVNDAECQATPI